MSGSTVGLQWVYSGSTVALQWGNGDEEAEEE